MVQKATKKHGPRAMLFVWILFFRSRHCVRCPVRFLDDQDDPRPGKRLRLPAESPVYKGQEAQDSQGQQDGETAAHQDPGNASPLILQTCHDPRHDQQGSGKDAGIGIAPDIEGPREFTEHMAEDDIGLHDVADQERGGDGRGNDTGHPVILRKKRDECQ